MVKKYWPYFLILMTWPACTFMYVPGDDAIIKVEKTGTDIDTQPADDRQKKGQPGLPTSGK